jgi:PAS domain S-box-containing protein
MQNEELRRTQLELETAQARYFDLYDLAPVGYCTVSEPGLIVQANLTAARLLGMAQGALDGVRFASFIDRDEEHAYYGFRKALLETDEARSLSLRMHRKDGTPFWACLEANTAEAGDGTTLCRLTLSDISGRRRAQEAQRESEMRIRNILDTVVDGIITIDETGVIEVANAASAHIFGYTPEQMLGMNVSMLMPEPHSSAHGGFIRRYLHTGQQHIVGNITQVRALRAGGELFPAEVTVSELFTSGRRLFTGVIRDITRRVETEAALAGARQQELHLRRRIQETLLFGKRPENLCGMSVGVASVPSRQVCGDFYDFFEYGANCFDVVVGDVMGKGTTAALLGAATKNHFLHARNHFAQGVNDRQPDPADIVNQVHSEVTPEFARQDIGVFVTLFYARFDLFARACTFVDCGHTKTLQLHLNKDRCVTLEGDNLPLGVLKKEHYEQHSAAFSPGDVFVLYSDGITDTRNPDGLSFGVDGIESVVLEYRHRDSEEIVSAVVRRASEFTRGVEMFDDATCLVVKIDPVETFSCQLPAELGQISKARQLVAVFFAGLTHAQAAEDIVIKAKSGLVEALTNIIKHAFRAEEGHVVDLRMEAYGDRMCMRLDYDGPFFQPGVVSAPNPEEMAESGYGLFIVEQCFSQVEYFVADDRRSTVLMTRNFHDE